MRTIKQRRGFTVVELMMGMLATSILVLAVGSMLYFGWLGWRRQTESVNMQRDALIAMKVMAKEIRNSTSDEVTYDGAGIYFSVSSPPVGRTTKAQFLASDIPQNAGVILKSFQVRKAGSTVSVDFTLATSDDTDQNTYRMSINARN